MWAWQVAYTLMDDSDGGGGVTQGGGKTKLAKATDTTPPTPGS